VTIAEARKQKIASEKAKDSKQESERLQGRKCLIGHIAGINLSVDQCQLGHAREEETS
jgi:hypothetical protein